MTSTTRVLVLGATGMLGSAMLRLFADSPGHRVFGSVRSQGTAFQQLPAHVRAHVIDGIAVDDHDALVRLFDTVRPDVVVNCVGLVKQLSEADEPLSAIPINSLLPHRLARLCKLVGARLVHISTDCVFTGSRGLYLESDPPDANDLYGRSKQLGEICAPHAVTLRTSIIGHELASAHGLINWFLSSRGAVRGFTRAVFSGLPTVELARVVRDFVMPATDLNGIYHVSSQPIDKYQLLRLVAAAYGHSVEIVPDDHLVIDRSLDSNRFRERTGYVPPGWPELVRRMQEFR